MTADKPGQPFFSVLIPSFNRPGHLSRAVESVLASEFPDFELVVSDDCSPRASEIARAMKRFEADDRVRFIPQGSNLGEPRNREFLHSVGLGEWQLFLSDDDAIERDALSKIAVAIKTFPGVQLFTFGYRLVDQFGRVHYSRRAPQPLSISRKDPEILKEFLCSEAFPYWFYQPATFCAHRGIHQQVKPNAHIGMGDDLMFLFDYVDNGGTILVLPQVLMSYTKFTASGHVEQPNQSSGHLANARTRYLMLRALETKQGLSTEFASVVETREFRERFVYNCLIADGVDPQNEARELQMIDHHLTELAAHHLATRAPGWRILALARRARFFVGLFGLAGALEIIKVAVQRASAPLRLR
jgi:glycosyltransferase involved in cell wall biosynthesis